MENTDGNPHPNPCPFGIREEAALFLCREAMEEGARGLVRGTDNEYHLAQNLARFVAQ
jgi:hypothetical protein